MCRWRTRNTLYGCVKSSREEIRAHISCLSPSYFFMETNITIQVVEKYCIFNMQVCAPTPKHASGKNYSVIFTISKIEVVPLTSLETTRISFSFGDFPAGIKNIPSGAISPAVGLPASRVMT